MTSKGLPIIFLLFFSSFVYSQVGWEGEWIDKCENDKCFGGNLTICETNGQIFGRYSNIGFLKGTIVNSNQVIGVWYEAGYTNENRGGFEFRFVSDDEFTGSWWFGIDSCIRNPWSSSRLSSIKPDAESCGILMPVNKAGPRIIEGEWSNSDGTQKLWMCVDDGVFFHGSGTSSLSGNYYLAGKSYESSTVLTGSSWVGNNVQSQGIFLIVFLSADEFVLSYWFVPSNAVAKNNLFTFQQNGADVFTKNQNFDDSTLEAACDTYNPSLDTFFYLSWHGSFFDTRLGRGHMHICPTGNINQTFHGIYSEIGWLEGYIDGNTVYGEYYNAGAHPTLDSGSFQLKLTNNGHSFEGFYTIHDTPVVWSGDRSSSLVLPSEESCWAPVALPETASLKGQWYYGKRAGDSFDICINDDMTVEISYFYNGDTAGYAVGYISETGPHSIRATWFEREGVYGVSMYRWLDEFTMIESLWASVQSVYDINYAICKLDNLDALNFFYWGRHSVNEITLFTASQNERLCSRNKHLYNPAVIYDPNYGSSSDNNSATSLALSIFSLCLAFFLLL